MSTEMPCGLKCLACGNPEPEGSAFCGACGARLTSIDAEEPIDEVSVMCPSCFVELLAPTSSSGEFLDCPGCGKPVQVPASKNPSKPKLGLKTSIDQASSLQMSQQNVNCQPSYDLMFCPQCGKGNQPGVPMCTGCGLRVVNGEFVQGQFLANRAKTNGRRRSGSSGNWEEESGCLISAGYVCAFLMPLVGVILSIVIMARGRRIGTGVAVLIISILMLGFWAAFGTAFWAALFSAA